MELIKGNRARNAIAALPTRDTSLLTFNQSCSRSLARFPSRPSVKSNRAKYKSEKHAKTSVHGTDGAARLIESQKPVRSRYSKCRDPKTCKAESLTS
eukprot:6204500-Pleurochrysis_carterae.AAC.1